MNSAQSFTTKWMISHCCHVCNKHTSGQTANVVFIQSRSYKGTSQCNSAYYAQYTVGTIMWVNQNLFTAVIYTTTQYMNDSTMNFETNLPTWNYILRMNGFVHDVFITQSTQECENKKLRKFKITSGVQGLCKIQIPEHLRESWKKNEKSWKIPKNRFRNLSFYTYSWSFIKYY